MASPSPPPVSDSAVASVTPRERRVCTTCSAGEDVTSPMLGGSARGLGWGMALPIEDYALIGDSRTAALVGCDGSIDWLCLPRFDSPACFAALLGTPDNGRWLLGPVGPAETTRHYLDDSSVLETTHTTPTGSFRVTDVMPIGDQRADLVRKVEALTGTVTVQHEWIVRL